MFITVHNDDDVNKRSHAVQFWTLHVHNWNRRWFIWTSLCVCLSLQSCRLWHRAPWYSNFHSPSL